jgi:hypothetical protein
MFEEQVQKAVDQRTKEGWRGFFKTLMDANHGQLNNAYAVYVAVGVK